MTLESHVQEGEQLLARIWKVVAFRGVLAVAFAVVVLIWPGIGLTAMVALFGAFALVSGVATAIEAVRLPLERGERGWLLFEALLGIVVGVIVFVWPSLSALGLLYAIGAWAIAAGMLQVGLAFLFPFGGARSLLLGLGGLVSVAFGVIMFARPGDGAIALLALVAAFAMVTGVMQIAYAIELRRIAADVKRAAPRVTTRPVTHG
jgi:uncharacterized membrane protein HdeD (DUF308 family)